MQHILVLCTTIAYSVLCAYTQIPESVNDVNQYLRQQNPIVNNVILPVLEFLRGRVSGVMHMFNIKYDWKQYKKVDIIRRDTQEAAAAVYSVLVASSSSSLPAH